MRSRSLPACSHPRAERAHGQDGGAPARGRAVADREVVGHHGGERGHRGAGQLGVLPAGDVAVDQAAQVVDADAEAPLLAPQPGGVEAGLVMALPRHRRGESAAERRLPGPGGEEVPGHHGVEHRRVAAEILGERGRRGGDVHDQVHQMGVGLEQREELRARGQPREEALERGQRLVGAGRGVDALHQGTRDPLEAVAGARRAQRGIGRPSLGRARGGRRVRGAHQALGPSPNASEPHLQPAQERHGVGRAVEARHPVELVGRRGHGVGLRVADHLKAVLGLAQGAVVLGQLSRGVGGQAVRLGEAGQRVERAAHAQPLVAAAEDELTRLGGELDLADAAGTELEVAARRAHPAAVAAMVADAPHHRVDVLDRGEVEMAAPHERPQPAQERRPRPEIARAGPRLDVGRPLPGAREALVVALGRIHRQDHRRRGRVGAQA